MAASNRLFNTSNLNIKHENANEQDERYQILQVSQKKGLFGKTHLNLINSGVDNVMELSRKEIEELHRHLGGILALEVK
jgi:hypothetical protein